MTKERHEEIEEIRVRYTEKFPKGYQYSQARRDVIALLGALDEAEARANPMVEFTLVGPDGMRTERCTLHEHAEGLQKGQQALLEVCEELEADRDRRKTRAQALESFIEHAGDYKCNACKVVEECDYPDNCPGWQFDEARFAVGDGENE